MSLAMNSRRDYRGNRAALFDDVEDGGIRASSSYSSQEIDEQENDRAMEGLQDRVLMLKRLTGDIHEEVDSHNRMLDRMVFETKSSRKMFTLVASFVVIFLIVYYLTRSYVTSDHLTTGRVSCLIEDYLAELECFNMKIDTTLSSSSNGVYSQLSAVIHWLVLKLHIGRKL